MAKQKRKELVRFFACLTLLSSHSGLEGAPSTAVVYPRLLEERSDGGELIVIIRMNQTLTLTKASVLHDELVVTTFEQDKHFVHHMNGTRMEQGLYQDPKTSSVVLLTRGEGLRLVGIIGSSERIQPSPTAEVDAAGLIKHELLPIAANFLDVPTAEGVHWEDDSGRYAHNVPEERSGDSPYPVSVTCEARVGVDSAFSQAFDGNKIDLLQYVAVQFAFANLKFGRFHPNIVTVQLIVKKLIIYSEEQETFIEKWNNDDSVILDKTMYNLNLLAYNNPEYEDDDIIVLLTARDLATLWSSGVNRDMTGIATAKGACRFHKAAVVEDLSRTFSSVHTLVHEIGHLLGSHHDGAKVPDRAAHEMDPSQCRAEEKYIMSPVLGSGMRPDFSYCSSIQVAQYAMSSDGDCLRNTVSMVPQKVTFDDVNRTRTSPAEFCKRQYPEISGVYHKEADEIDPEHLLINCVVTCRDPDNPHKVFVHDAPDGMRCTKGTRLMCLNGKCTRLRQTPLVTFSEDVKNSALKGV